MAAGLLPFVLLEAGLRCWGLGELADGPDLLSGFNRRSTLFARVGDVYRTARAREPFFQPQAFPVAKPRHGLRIFCFGGSTVYGHPFRADTAFPQWLELELNGSDPARACQVINCGGISYASYRLAPLVDEILQYQPDLIILATGHNEFLEDRTYQAIKHRPAAWARLQAAAGSLRIVSLARRWLATRGAPDAHVPPDSPVRARLDAASGYASYHRDDAWREKVVAQFDASVRRMVAACRAAGVPLLLVKLGSNLRDCPPFKSEHRANLAADEEREWQKFFDAATAAEAADPAHALELYRRAEAIDGQFALLQYRLARNLDRLGRTSEALIRYGKARDEDICPLRMIKPLEDALVRIAEATGTPLLDAARLLATESFDFIPGFESYLDHVHPTIGGHQKIARALAARLRAGGWQSPAAEWTEADRRQAYARHLEQLGDRYFAEGRQRVRWLEDWARRERLFHETLPQDPRGYVRLGFRQFDLGDEPAACRSLEEALQRDAAVFGLLQERAEELAAQGRPQFATHLLPRLAARGKSPHDGAAR